MQRVCEAAGCDSMDQLMRVGMGVDSQTAMGRWKKLRLPESIQDHLHARTLRVIGWVTKVARTLYWPCFVRWFNIGESGATGLGAGVRQCILREVSSIDHR